MIVKSFYELKKDVLDILDSKIEVEKKDRIPDDSAFTFENGVRCFSSALFIDIVNSTDYFSNKSMNENVLARILRSLIGGIAEIINDTKNVYEVGIRGDSVYGIFHSQYKSEMVEVFRTAFVINSYMKMFNKILSQKGYPNIKIGIGLAADSELIVKVGKKRIVNDKVWIGEAVFEASNLSKIANRRGNDPIYMNYCFYNNVIDDLKKENVNYSTWIKSEYTSNWKTTYHCDIVSTSFNNWIDGGMKDE